MTTDEQIEAATAALASLGLSEGFWLEKPFIDSGFFTEGDYAPLRLSRRIVELGFAPLACAASTWQIGVCDTLYTVENGNLNRQVSVCPLNRAPADLREAALPWLEALKREAQRRAGESPSLSPVLPSRAPLP